MQALLPVNCTQPRAMPAPTLEKRLRMRPTGVVSKKDTGARTCARTGGLQAKSALEGQACLHAPPQRPASRTSRS